MAVSGLPEPCDDHARCIANLALDMFDLSQDLHDPDGNAIMVRRYLRGNGCCTQAVGGLVTASNVFNRCNRMSI